MNLAAWLARAGLADGDAPAIGVGTVNVLTYAELARRAGALARGLQTRHALAPGDRVAIIAKNHPSYVEALFGTWWGGFAAVPVNPKLHDGEVRWILEHCQASAVIVSPDLAAAIGSLDLDRVPMYTFGDADYEQLVGADAIAPPLSVSDDRLAWLFYTSGTTGRPKGAMLSHGNLAAMTMGYFADVDVPPAGGSLLHAAPMSHGSGLYIMSHVCRRGVNVVTESGGFDGIEVIDVAVARGGAAMFAAPTMVNRIVRAAPSGAPFRTLIWGGAPMYAGDVVAALDTLGPCLAQIYGQGESPMTVTVLAKDDIGDREHSRWLQRLGSAGLPNSIVDVRVVHDGGAVSESGELGEVQVRGATVMSGYWENDAATADAFDGDWLRTGDIGTFDDDGYLTLRDRSKDVIISGGSNIYPREVEEVLLTHPDVDEAAVIGRPDPEWGEVVIAYVAGKVEPGELDAICLDNIARFKRPKEYVFIPELPKNSTGKILRKDLRESDQMRTR